MERPEREELERERFHNIELLLSTADDSIFRSTVVDRSFSFPLAPPHPSPSPPPQVAAPLFFLPVGSSS